MRILAALLIAAACAEEPVTGGMPPSEFPPPAEGEGFQLDEGRFVVDPAGEALYCMRLPIPEAYGEDAVFVSAVETDLPDSTHHFFMAYREEPVPAAEPCSPDGPLLPIDGGGDVHDGGGGKMIFLSGSGRYRYELPAGYALHLPSGRAHMITSHHVLNGAESAREMYGRFNVFTTPSAPHPVNVLNCLLQDIWVAPDSEADVSATCTAPFDLDLVVLGSHAHQHLVRFEMRFFDGESTTGEPFYVSDDWDSPAIVPLETPMRLAEGEGITFTCRFRNTGDDWIVFGTGDFGEMCAVMSQYAFPEGREGEVPPSLGTIVYREGEGAALVETTGLDGPF